MELQPRVHGSSHSNPARCATFESVTRIKSFIHNYAEQNSLVLPGQVSSYSNPDLFLLPSSDTKEKIYHDYSEACKQDSVSPLSLDYFRKSWRTFLPNIVIQKPLTDLCSECQHNFRLLGTLRNLDKTAMLTLLQTSTRHLNEVKKERECYQNDVSECKKFLHGKSLVSELTVRKALTYIGKIHYSFDYAQQIHIPHSSQQAGPIYFLTPYKVGLFGVACEPANKMVIYIIPECLASGKGSKSVISYLHHFLNNFGYGETE